MMTKSRSAFLPAGGKEIGHYQPKLLKHFGGDAAGGLGKSLKKCGQRMLVLLRQSGGESSTILCWYLLSHPERG